MSDIYSYLREKFPPARAVAALTTLVLPWLAIFNGWLANHLPLIAKQVGPDQITAIVVATIAGGVALAYKWLDGRAKWETTQVNAQVAVSNSPEAAEKLEEKGVLETPPVKRRRDRRRSVVH